MSRYTPLHAPVLAFYSKDLYRDACFNWKGTGFGYLFLLLALCWAPLAGMLQLEVNRFFAQLPSGVLDKMPEVSITNGIASIREASPLAVTDPADTNRVVAWFDMTGSNRAPEGVLIAVTASNAVFRLNAAESRPIAFQGIKAFDVNRAQIDFFATKWAFASFYPFVVVSSFFYRMLLVLVFGGIGLLFAQWAGSPRRYPELLRMAVLAVTPVTLLDIVLSLLKIRMPPLIQFGFPLIALGYLYFGVKAAAEGAPGAGGEAGAEYRKG